MGVFDVFQIPYSAVERELEGAIATAAQKGAGIVIRGGAAKGDQPRGGRRGCSGNAGAGHTSMACSRA
jgi:hypothetical protein